MGNFFTLIKRGVIWIGKQIVNIFMWFANFIKCVAKKVVCFLKFVRDKILMAEEPKLVGKYVGVKKEIEHLEKYANDLKKDMTKSDINLADDILKSKNKNDDFNDALDNNGFDEEFEKMMK